MLSILLTFSCLCGSPGVPNAPFEWPAISCEQRPGCYWWWMASAVDEANITRQLEQYKAAGMGGVHIIPIYGAKGYEDRYVDYLSPRWMELLHYTVSEAKRIGLFADMTTGTGWCFGGPTITDDLACASVKHDIKDVAGGDLVSLAFDYPIQAAVAYASDGRIVELTDKITAGNALHWQAPDGRWKLHLVWQQNAGTRVKRSAPGGAGYMLNPFYGKALQTYLQRFDEAFAASPGPMPRAQYHDSFEYYKCDWSPDLFEQFAKRRGYRLQEHLHEFFADPPVENTARVKCDYRETIADMMLENFTRPWVEWAHAKGCVTRNQAHGSPGNLLDLYAAADIPETEMFHDDRNPLVSKFASSAAHVAGRKLVAAETGTWLAEHFTETLAQLKERVDDLFLSGVNHVIYHGNCYSPADAPWPGWLFYASTEMNPRNSFWHDVPALNDYIARCQSILQEGQPDNDILVYWPIHDLWQDPEGLVKLLTVHKRAWFEEQSIGRVAANLAQNGYCFDYISDRQLMEATATDSGIKTPGCEYKALLVPECRNIPVDTMRQLIKLAEAGAKIVFEKALPQDVPGLGNLEQRRGELRQMVDAIRWEDGARRHALLGKGGFFVAPELPGDIESWAGVVREAQFTEKGIASIRRRDGDVCLHFAVNRGKDTVGCNAPEAMNPLMGRLDANAALLQPGQSAVFKSGKGQGVACFPGARDPLKSKAITGKWQITFIEGGPELPEPFATDALGSWTGRGDGKADCFAGTARYSTTFDRPQELHGEFWRLDLGRVAESARVRLNGKELATLIMPPYAVDIDDKDLLDTGNVLEVDVTNLSANRIRDLDRRGVKWKIFHDTNFVNIDYKPFDASDWPIRESGLLGPVSIQPVEKFSCLPPGRVTS